MKSSLTLLCLVASISSVSISGMAAAFSEKSRFEKRPAMQPIRRLGLVPVVHNTQDARRRLADQTTLRGILAQPLSNDDLAQKFNGTLKAVADASGRFWTLDAIPSENVAGRAASAGELSSFQRAQLVNEYDLDGWLSAEIYFTADHTAVRLGLTGPQLKPTVAREDILLPYGADWDDIANALAQTIGRLSETIGHDGRVVFESEELLGIDFGVERGLVNGQRLRAGLVVQTAAHPQTGEILRYQRFPLYELEVVDAKQGASLCRKVALDPDLIRQAESSYGSGTDRKFQLLVWRDGNAPAATAGLAGWRPQESANARADSTRAGFVPREPAVQNPQPSTSSGSQTQSERTRTSAEVSGLSRPPATVAMSGGDGFSLPSVRKDSGAFLATMRFSAGSSSGTLDLSKGPVSSELPGYLLNTFSLQDGFRYASEWNIRYGAEYAMFEGNLNGSRFSFKGSGLAPSSSLQIPDFPINWGVEGQYSTGTVKTDKSKKTLDAFELFGVLATERVLDGGWGLGIEYKQSMTGLLAGAFAFEAGVDVHPGAPAPKELGVQWRFINDGDKWTEWMLGLSWKLGAAE
ncbi:MAG: hypothetical protein ACO3A4_07510 [Silvanigrellaceae bacterium]